MPERQSRHPDNDRIEEITEGGTVSQVGRDIGTRADLKRAEGYLEGQEVERAHGGDNPEQDARKGPKSLNHMSDKGGGSSPSQ